MIPNAVAQKTVLIVDDDPFIRESLAELLTEEGYLVATACNGDEGLRQLDLAKPQLILLDMRMPAMDGWEFKERMDANPLFSHIPVFVFSAQSGMNPPGIKATGFISKPIDIDKLLETIRPYLQ